MESTTENTSGVYQFNVDDMVLCYYGPVLYEAKVLKRRKPKKWEAQYLLHYRGWKDSHDEWVTESLLIEYNKDNLIKMVASKQLLKKMKTQNKTKRKYSVKKQVAKIKSGQNDENIKSVAQKDVGKKNYKPLAINADKSKPVELISCDVPSLTTEPESPIMASSPSSQNSNDINNNDLNVVSTIMLPNEDGRFLQSSSAPSHDSFETEIDHSFDQNETSELYSEESDLDGDLDDNFMKTSPVRERFPSSLGSLHELFDYKKRAVKFQPNIIAERISDENNKKRELLISWFPPDVLEDEWITFDENTNFREIERIVPIMSMDADDRNTIAELFGNIFPPAGHRKRK